MKMTPGEHVQFMQLERGPVWAGNLICKDSTWKLRSRGLVSYDSVWARLSWKGWLYSWIRWIPGLGISCK